MFIKKIANKYLSLLYKYPLRIQAVQTGVLMGIGDLLAQTVVQHTSVSGLDWGRCARYSSIGLVLVGPAVGKWILFLEKLIGQGGISTVLKKTALDQLCFAPIFLVVVISAIGITGGQTIDEIKSNLQENYKDILLTNYEIWPAAQLLNFYVIPLHFRILFVQLVAIVWNCYLSTKLSTNLETVPLKLTEEQ